MRYLTGRFLQEQPFDGRAVRQRVGAYDLAGAYVQEGGADRLQGNALLLGPGEPVDGELERVGGAAAAGLPVDDLVRRPGAGGGTVAVAVPGPGPGPARVAAVLPVDGVDAAADDPAGDLQLEGASTR